MDNIEKNRERKGEEDRRDKIIGNTRAVAHIHCDK
jgi:hypothetical protein